MTVLNFISSARMVLFPRASFRYLGEVKYFYEVLLFWLGLSVLLGGCARESSPAARQAHVPVEESPKTSSSELCRPAETDGEEFLKAGIVGGKILRAQTSLGAKMALIVFQKDGQTQLCSGTLVTNDVILTAAHCVVPDIKAMRVVFTHDFICGSAANEKTSQRVYSVKKAVAHNEFQTPAGMNIENDIGLIQIIGVRPSDMSPVVLAPQDSIRAEDRLLMLGYGMTEHEGIDAGRLRVVGKKGRDLLHLPTLRSGFFVDQKKSGICNGDSGGPLFRVTDKGLELVGVASAVLNLEGERSSCNGYSYFVDINIHLDWIKETLIKFRQKGPVGP